ncbi:FAD/NAD-P-binding domain-containing protein [Dentipellis sp. KUC8613]|nr:FAD/NAD-P-binding domain-containing protein [Dentipellis sp. KUC8613]
MASRVADTLSTVIKSYVQESINAAASGHILTLINPWRAILLGFSIFYILVQGLIIFFFKPSPPNDDKLEKPFGRIAIIGAGLTGVSSAAHCIAHNFDVVLYEAGPRPGGIWSHVNKTSGLQLNSLLYRFHPGVLWSRAFPYRDEILSEITRIWKEYKLESRTHFNTPVRSVHRVEGTKSPGAKWTINDGKDGVFDAVIVTVGTCGPPQMVGFPGMPELDAKDDSAKSEHHGINGRNNDGKDKVKQSSDKRKEEVRRKVDQLRRDPHEDNTHYVGDVDPREDGAPSFAEVAKHEPAVQDGDPTSPGQSSQSRNTNEKKEKHAPASKPEKKENLKKDSDEKFEGRLHHSSQIDDADVKDKIVVVIGSGASGVEAVETALQLGAKKTIMIARDDKWIIPRNIVFDTTVSAQPFGREMPFSFIWERVLKHWQYHGVEDLIPSDKGIYDATPVVNDEFLEHVRTGRCEYIRGDTLQFTKRGVQVRVRPHGTKPGQKRSEDGESKQNDHHSNKVVKQNKHHTGEFPVEEIQGDVVVLATGFQQPSVDFLPKDLFAEGYERPDLYLQNFATEDWSVLLTNSAYVNAIGHIGIYTRILLVLLLDESARPEPKDMKLWVDAIRFVKRGARGGALGFFTYMELTIWFILFHIFRPDRLRWIFFVMQGWGLDVNRIQKKTRART